jgi:hypothetical protein
VSTTEPESRGHADAGVAAASGRQARAAPSAVLRGVLLRVSRRGLLDLALLPEAGLLARSGCPPTGTSRPASGHRRGAARGRDLDPLRRCFAWTRGWRRSSAGSSARRRSGRSLDRGPVGLREEYLFRGALQQKFGIWVATIVFAVIHWPLNPNFFPWPFVAGLIGLGLGGLALWTQSLVAPAGGPRRHQPDQSAPDHAALRRLGRDPRQ